MRKALVYAITIIAGLMSIESSAETLVYKCTMRLNVPRVYDNMQSQGKRKMQWQKVVGYITVDTDLSDRSEDEEEFFGTREPAVYASEFINKTHKISTGKVTYSDCAADNVMWRFIGSNKTGVFKHTNLRFSLDLDPSYNIGDDEPDNTLVITLSGDGSSCKKISGYVTGQIGCGCRVYGHTSPTRTIGCEVDDIVPLYGKFTMKLVGTCR